MLVKKEIIRPGIYWYADQQTGLPRKFVATPERIKHLFDNGQRMLAANLSVPVPLEHQPDATPLTPAQRAAKRLENNSGWVQKYELDANNFLFGHLDIQDDKIAEKLPKTIRWTSPNIGSFTDGNGTAWDGVITHLALTTRPRIVEQQPFPNVAAALSYTAVLKDTLLEPANLPKDGVALSRAGLLDMAGKPLYPMAFSFYSGIALADEGPAPPPDVKKKKKPEGPPKKEGGDKPPAKGEAKPFEAGAGKEPEEEGDDLAGPDKGFEPTPALPGIEGAEMPLVDADGDISVYDVLCDLLETVGIMLPSGTTKDNFAQHLYEATMGAVKGKAAESVAPEEDLMADDLSNKPPGGKNQAPPNPIIQEQQPMYMSAEQIAKITDPTMKSMALSLQAQQKRAASLEANAINAAKRLRQERIDRLSKVLSPAAKEKLLAKSKEMGFSLGDDGVVTDQMTGFLEIMDDAMQKLPTLMKPSEAFDVQPHPREYEGAMSEERRQEVIKELSRNAGLAVAEVK